MLVSFTHTHSHSTCACVGLSLTNSLPLYTYVRRLSMCASVFVSLLLTVTMYVSLTHCHTISVWGVLVCLSPFTHRDSVCLCHSVCLFHWLSLCRSLWLTVDLYFSLSPTQQVFLCIIENAKTINSKKCLWVELKGANMALGEFVPQVNPLNPPSHSSPNITDLRKTSCNETYHICERGMSHTKIRHANPCALRFPQEKDLCSIPQSQGFFGL